MASLQHDDAVRYPARRRAGRAALLALALVAACGGDRNRATGADTVGASAVTPDSAAMPVTDTAAPAAPDTATTATRPARRAARPPARREAGPGARAERPARKPTPPRNTPPRRHRRPPAAPAPAAATSSASSPSRRLRPRPVAAQDSLAAAENAGSSLRDAYHQAPRDTVSQAVYNGWKQFNLNCARCHGEDVLGTTIAPHLIVSLKPDGPINTKEIFVQTVCAGPPREGHARVVHAGSGHGQDQRIYQYVKGRSDAKISPGRPAVKPEG